MNWAQRKYGQAYENWPRDAAGETVPPAFLIHCSPLDMQADMLQNMLEAFGVPSVRRLPGDGQFGEVMLGMSGSGVDIYVPETMLEEAKALMEGEAEDDGLEEGV